MNFNDLDIARLRQRGGKKWSTFDADVLPAWVADMDFPLAPPIAERLHTLWRHQDFGYPHDAHPARLVALLVERARRRHQWTLDPARVEVIADVVQGLQVCLDLYTRPGDGVLILTPIYPPFLSTTAAMGRRADICPLVQGDDGYEIDWAGLERVLRPDTRLLMLCSPHNPTGRVFSRRELSGLAALARRHDLTVVADEIHADLSLPGHTHIPFASLDPDAAARSVTLVSASKAFNIAGLRCAMMAFGSEALQAPYRAGPRFLRGAASSLGMHAAEVAWRDCDDWLAALLAHLQANRDHIGTFLAEQLPEVGYLPPQSTYLAWLDCRALGHGDALCQRVLERGRLALNDGRDFGTGGAGFLRLNFATSRGILDEVLARLRHALAG